MNEKRWLTLILILFLALGFIYALVTPVFEASDELWHYPMARHLSDGNPLPVQVFDPNQAGPWKQEASQPPLYYYLGALLTFWIDTSDMADVRIENPHVDNGIITQDGNINLVMHNPEANPWRGTLLAVRIIRIFSVLLGACTVILTYLISRQTAPDRPEIALGAAAANAFLPMFLFISGSVNNDNLAIMLASLALFMMIRIVQRQLHLGTGENGLSVNQDQKWNEKRNWLVLGIVIGAGLLTKQGTIGLLPLAWGTTMVASWYREKQDVGLQKSDKIATFPWLVRLFGRSLLSFAVLLLPVLIIAGWWYWRNIELYGDLLGWNAFIAVLGQRAHPASLLQLWGERRGFLMAYWGLFGGVNVPMPDWIYLILNGFLLLSVAGFFIYFFRILRQWIFRVKDNWRSAYAWINNLFLLVAANFGLIVCILFVVAVVFGLIRWATTTWSSQGRLVFTALSALSVLFVIGLVGWLPSRLARWLVGLLSTLLFSIAAVAPFLWIAPVYDPQSYVAPHVYVLHAQNTIFGEKIRLVQVAVETAEPGSSVAHPGQSVWVHLEWELLEPVDQNWSVFVHLVDPVLEQPIAQRDMYPGQGLILTSWMKPGARILNSYQLQIPETAVAPSQLNVVTGLYDYYTGERLPIDSGQDVAHLARLQVKPAAADLPNPVSINLEDEIRLVGFDINPRRVLPGETIDLTLYWQANKILKEDYTFFAQVVGEDTTRWASQDLASPEGTPTWDPGKLQALEFALNLDENSPPGLYPLIIGAYTRNENGGFDRLQVRTPDGRLTEDFIELTSIRIDQVQDPN